jgi:hypothetical protein
MRDHSSVRCCFGAEDIYASLSDVFDLVARPLEAENEFPWMLTQGGMTLRYATRHLPWAIRLSPVGAREPQWLGTKFTFRRKGEAMKGG